MAAAGVGLAEGDERCQRQDRDPQLPVPVSRIIEPTHKNDSRGLTLHNRRAITPVQRETSRRRTKAQEKTASVENQGVRDVPDVVRTQHAKAETHPDVA
jgi:hypothetical protein